MGAGAGFGAFGAGEVPVAEPLQDLPPVDHGVEPEPAADWISALHLPTRPQRHRCGWQQGAQHGPGAACTRPRRDRGPHTTPAAPKKHPTTDRACSAEWCVRMAIHRSGCPEKYHCREGHCSAAGIRGAGRQASTPPGGKMRACTAQETAAGERLQRWGYRNWCQPSGRISWNPPSQSEPGTSRPARRRILFPPVRGWREVAPLVKKFPKSVKSNHRLDLKGAPAGSADSGCAGAKEPGGGAPPPVDWGEQASNTAGLSVCAAAVARSSAHGFLPQPPRPAAPLRMRLGGHGRS